MKSVERREEILKLILENESPVSGSALAEKLSVSRQIIVGDVAWLKENGYNIIATSKGYIINHPPKAKTVFKVIHSDEDIEKELNSIIALGGTIVDVFVWHRVYGKIRGELNLSTEEDVREYIKSLRTGCSGPLKNITSGYHYHTVTAKNETALDNIKTVLEDMNFLVNEE